MFRESWGEVEVLLLLRKSVLFQLLSMQLFYLLGTEVKSVVCGKKLNFVPYFSVEKLHGKVVEFVLLKLVKWPLAVYT